MAVCVCVCVPWILIPVAPSHGALTDISFCGNEMRVFHFKTLLIKKTPIPTDNSMV